MGGDGNEPSAEEIFDEMEVLEPYTTGELASLLEVPKRHVRKFLERLSKSGKVRKKEPGSSHIIWIRKAPVHECQDCGYKYEVKPLHPVLSTVRFCPRCGNQL